MNNFTQFGYPLTIPTMDKSTPGLFVSYLGLFQSSGDFLYEQVAPRHYLHFIKQGVGVFEIDGETFHAGKQDCITFFPGTHIKYFDSPQTPWHYTWFRLEGAQVEWALAQAGITPQQPSKHLPDTPDLKQLLTELEHHAQTKNYSTTYPIAIAWRIIDALQQANQTDTATARPNLADDCKRIIENALTQPTIDGLAARFNVDRSTLYRRFKQRHGISPKAYIEQVRFEKACRLLTHTNEPVSEIALACEFDRLDHFSKAFKGRYGCSPRSWRQKK